MGSADWQIVGYSDDPIPDDTTVVANQIAHLRSVAATIASQVAELPQSGHLDALVWHSQDNDAPTQFRQQASQLPNDLDLLRTRYVKVADALDEFHPVLTSTQGTARAQLTVAVSAYQDMQAAQTGVTQQQDFQYQAQQSAANQNANLAPGQTPVEPAQWTGPDYPAILTDATTRYNTAKGKIHGAVNTFNGASQTAAGKVNAAGDDNLKNKSSGFWGFVEDVVQASSPLTLLRYIPGIQSAEHIFVDISEIAGVVSAVAALAALIPIPGFDIVADAISEGAGAVEGLADVIVIDTDDNAKERQDATKDLGLTLLGLATGGVSRVVGRGAAAAEKVADAGKELEEAKGAAKLADKGLQAAKDLVAKPYTAKDMAALASLPDAIRPGAEVELVAKSAAKARDALAAAGGKVSEAQAVLDKAGTALDDAKTFKKGTSAIDSFLNVNIVRSFKNERAVGKVPALLDLDKIHAGKLSTADWVGLGAATGGAALAVHGLIAAAQTQQDDNS